MDLQISVFLLFSLFTAGHSFRCYVCRSDTGSCEDQTIQTCSGGSSMCGGSTEVRQVGGITVKEKIKGCSDACQNGSMSVAISKVATSCCHTDQCNFHDAPDPSDVPNGKKCYYCDGKSCSHTLSCSGDEDRCFISTESFEGQTVVLKGCVTKSLCGNTTSVRNVGTFSCCEGNLCNGAPSVSQSFLFLCCSLLSYFLLH